MTLEERFWSKVDKENGPLILDTPCWNWIAGTTSCGYGIIRTGSRTLNNRKLIQCHRLAWEFQHGPTTLCVLHKCDNPACVRLDHLFLGTLSDNMKDCSKKKRLKYPTGSYNAKITASQAEEIRKLAASGEKHVSLGERFGLHPLHIRDIVKRRYWK